MLLKADLHLHTREREPLIPYDARALIDRAAAEGYRVLSITNHDALTWSEGLADYARARGIVLIPGVEATIEGKHVLVYNPHVDPARLRTFADLRRHRTPEWLVVAPHPFFPRGFCLRERLLAERDLFDAVEFSHFYLSRLDPNRRAVRVAAELGLPLLGTSDSHLPVQFGTTFSVIDAEPTVAGVLAAIRQGRVSVVSRPLSLGRFARVTVALAAFDLRARLGVASRRTVPAPGQPTGEEVIGPAS